MLPEIRARFREIFSGFGSEPISLGIESKTFGGVAFDAINVGWYARNGYPGIASILAGGAPAWSGEAVSVESALNHSVVWACYRLISESVGMIPNEMMQKKGNDKHEADHPMYSALKNAPNDEITANGFSEMLTGHCLMEGNAYAQIIRRSGPAKTAIELHAIPPQCVYPDREKTGQRRLTYTVKIGNEQEKVYTVQRGKPHEILHIRGLGWDGIRGFSVITMGRQSIGTSIAAERNAARFWAAGGRVPYLLQLEQPWKTTQDGDQFRADWERLYSEPHRAVIAPPNVKYQQIGLNSKDAQALETRLFDIHEICRWFLVSPHMVGDLSRATFSNIEQLALEFVKMTLSSWLTRWEQELWRCVLTDEEKGQGFFFRHNINSLLRGDFQSRMAGYATALQNGYMNENEVRDLEDMNRFDGGDAYHIQVNMATLPGTGAPIVSPQAAGTTIGTAPPKKGLHAAA